MQSHHTTLHESILRTIAAQKPHMNGIETNRKSTASVIQVQINDSQH
uniref:Uncharacterized protein n=1 Tax=Anguilla anguilla TaxID=7936 RepID=A0A0E9STI7_ANGAN